MIVDVRNYITKPGHLPLQLALYEQYALPVQVRHLGKPFAFLSAETGDRNAMTHLWVYDSAADREERRARMQQDPQWHEYLRRNIEGGHLQSQQTSLMVPVSFAPLHR
jgi:hypothetical protein